jgi:hypothetical protein
MKLCATVRTRPKVNAWVELPAVASRWTSCGPATAWPWKPTGTPSAALGRAFERDRRRDQRLLMAGFRVARFTWRQVIDHPDEGAATLDALLAR